MVINTSHEIKRNPRGPEETVPVAKTVMTLNRCVVGKPRNFNEDNDKKKKAGPQANGIESKSRSSGI